MPALAPVMKVIVSWSMADLLVQAQLTDLQEVISGEASRQPWTRTALW
jgi:hypothetical protein